MYCDYRGYRHRLKGFSSKRIVEDFAKKYPSLSKIPMDEIIWALVNKYLEGLDTAVEKFDAKAIATMAKKVAVLADVVEQYGTRTDDGLVFKPKVGEMLEWKRVKNKLVEECEKFYKKWIEEKVEQNKREALKAKQDAKQAKKQAKEKKKQETAELLKQATARKKRINDGLEI